MKFELEDFHRNISDEALINDIKQVAAGTKHNFLTIRQYSKHGKFSADTIIRRFGTWIRAIEKAGFKATRQQLKGVAEEELFENLEEVWVKLGRQPRWREMRSSISKYGPNRYGRYFGSWQKALEKFVVYVNKEGTISSEAGIKSLKIGPTTKHRTSRTINWRLRFLVMRRDDFKCKICGTSPAIKPGTTLHVDHIKAWTKGGETALENLQTLCKRCNIGKSNL
ncbi:MAG: HNH endonuclease [Phycisphaerae bacterium]|nr:HNH endonuclease [Phycisphaerae bacterium]